MIFIAARFRVLAEHADAWPQITRSFTEATRAEPGNLWFDWSRDLDDPQEYVLIEAFEDDAAGDARGVRPLQAGAGRAAGSTWRRRPRILNTVLEGSEWNAARRAGRRSLIADRWALIVGR